MADFVTDDNIVEFFGFYKSGFAIGNLPTYIREAGYEEIIQRAGSDWVADIEDVTLYLDGRGDKDLWIPEPPILSLTSLTYISKTLEETDLTIDQTDEDRQIWYDANTGHIQLIQPITGIEYGWDEDSIGVFPTGVQNIKIVGKFGTANPNAILTIIQLYCMLRHMARIDPSTYGKGDLVSEKIGKYSYELYGKTSTKSERMSLDQYIDYLYGLLPSFNSFLYDAV